MKRLSDRFWTLASADFLSPKDFVRHAMLILVVFGLVHAIGLRECTSVLNGTTGVAGMDIETATLLGMVYIFFYLGAVVVAPILLLAGGLLALWQMRRKHSF